MTAAWIWEREGLLWMCHVFVSFDVDRSVVHA